MAADKKDLGIAPLLEREAQDRTTEQTEKTVDTTNQFFRSGKSYAPMLTNEASIAITNMGRLQYEIGTENVYKTQTKELTMTMRCLPTKRNASGEMGLTQAQIFTFASSLLTRQNSKDSSAINPVVSFPLKEYAELCGYDVIPRITEDMDDSARASEESRTKNLLKHVRKTLKHDFEELKTLSISGTIKTIKQRKKSEEDWFDMVVMPTLICRNGRITIRFNDDYVRVLLDENKISYFHLSLLKVRKNRNAFFIGQKMAIHSSIIKNNITGRNLTLSFRTILESRPFGLKESEVKNRRYKQLIITPTLRELDELVEVGFLESYRIEDATHKKLTREEAEKLGIQDFKGCFVIFYIKDNPMLDDAQKAAIDTRIKQLETIKRSREKKTQKKTL